MEAYVRVNLLSSGGDVIVTLVFGVELSVKVFVLMQMLILMMRWCWRMSYRRVMLLTLLSSFTSLGARGNRISSLKNLKCK